MTVNNLFLKIGSKNLTLKLKDTLTAKKIYDSVPIRSKVSTWGKEIYFNTGLSIERELEAKEIVDKGEIAFWTEGSSIAIGFGPTPIPQGDEIRLAAPCNIWANAEFDKNFFSDVKDGDEVLVEKS